ncbi:hypothetical protein F8388_014779 [Cannabis sativa]|uniref:Uncharacterized protein n=1 Tax=Cannabis sativa TaxID=3483 RepID=A0A7J6GYQ8_CANSA|nr:hypothetical protein F8388_014779 [Cannabis sativa]
MKLSVNKEDFPEPDHPSTKTLMSTSSSSLEVENTFAAKSILTFLLRGKKGIGEQYDWSVKLRS